MTDSVAESSAPLLAVAYRPDEHDPGQDEVFEFRFEDQRRTFGRDPGCDIVIWTAINDRDLTRVDPAVRRRALGS